MSPELVGFIIGGLLGSGGIGALLKARYDKNKSDTDAMAVWNQVWTGNLDRLSSEMDELRRRVADLEAELRAEMTRNHVLSALLIEHKIPLPPND